MTDADRKLGEALQELVGRIVVEGTPVAGCEAGIGGCTTYKAPWYVIDKAFAEPEVNWPGQLVGTADDMEEARRMQSEEIGRLAREELATVCRASTAKSFRR